MKEKKGTNCSYFMPCMHHYVFTRHATCRHVMSQWSSWGFIVDRMGSLIPIHISKVGTAGLDQTIVRHFFFFLISEYSSVTSHVYTFFFFTLSYYFALKYQVIYFQNVYKQHFHTIKFYM